MSQFVLNLSVDGNTELYPFVENQLKILQRSVGGYVEAIALADDLVMWVNEEGKNENLPFNQAATSIFMKYKGGSDFIVGPVAFTGGADANGETLGLSEIRINEIQVFAAMSKVN